MNTQANVPAAPKRYDPFGPYRGVPPKPTNRESSIVDDSRVIKDTRYTPEEYVLLFKRFS